MKENLLKSAGLIDRARKIFLRGKEAIVPLKFDEEGNPATTENLIVKRLSLSDLRFLGAWRDAAWDVEKAVQALGIERDKAERLIKKLSCFREEDARVKALCQIPTPSWIASKHVENVYNPTLEDSQHKSLQELAKIEGAYKQVAVNTQLNVFNISLTPEQEAKLKPVYDAIALEAANDAA